MVKLLTIVVSLLAAGCVHHSSASTETTDSEDAQRPKVRGILLGHNLTPTSYTLEKGAITAGTYALAYGVTDRLTIATSTWLDYAYNMPNFDVRYSFRLSDFIQNANFESIYFKTFNYGAGTYRQESLFERFVGTRYFAPSYTLHVSLGYQYFFEDEYPFSLRLRPGNGSRYNLDFSTLSEIHLTEHLGVFVELGTLGLNYAVPYLHTGLSVFGKWNWGVIQLGMSRSKSFRPVQTGIAGYEFTDTVWHPEVQLQFNL
jgi:hypothetical protein